MYLELKPLEALRHTELPQVAAPWYAINWLKQARSGYCRIGGFHNAWETCIQETDPRRDHWNHRAHGFEHLCAQIEEGDWVIVLDPSWPPLAPAYAQINGQWQLTQHISEPRLRQRLESHIQTIERQQREQEVLQSRNQPSSADVQTVPASGAGNRAASLGPHVGKLSAAQAMPVKNSLQQSVTPNEATMLFDKAKADTKIPFDYPLDCCYSRAHEMCRQFETEGVECRKAWNYSSPGNSLRADTSKNAVTPGGYVEWRYHVAPLLAVTQPDGSIQDYIIDPSLHDRPVPIDVWKSRMNDAGSIFKTTDSKPYYQSADGSHKLYDADYSETNNMLKEHGRTRDGLTSRTTGK